MCILHVVSSPWNVTVISNYRAPDKTYPAWCVAPLCLLCLTWFLSQQVPNLQYTCNTNVNSVGLTTLWLITPLWPGLAWCILLYVQWPCLLMQTQNSWFEDLLLYLAECSMEKTILHGAFLMYLSVTTQSKSSYLTFCLGGQQTDRRTWSIYFTLLLHVCRVITYHSSACPGLIEIIMWCPPLKFDMCTWWIMLYMVNNATSVLEGLCKKHIYLINSENA